jgi:hypothetical protein
MNRFMNHYKTLNMNYESGVAYSLIHCTDLVFSLGRLPAAPNFYRKKQNRKTKTAVNFTVGNWADSESD